MSGFKKIEELEKRLWSAADQLQANTNLTSQENSRPVLGLIFLRYAEYRFEQARERLAGCRGRKRGRSIKTTVQAEVAMYVPDDALFSNLRQLSEDQDLGKAIKDALPKTYTRFSNEILATLLKNFAHIRFDIRSDVFGRIYEYFMTEFARTEGGKEGEFFTPSSLARLITEIIEPYHGKVYDPACGSGNMLEMNIKCQELQEKFQSTVEQYNLEAYTAEQFFEDLKNFVRELDEEARRASREGLSEEELTIFDLLVSHIELSETKRKKVKGLTKELIEKLKNALVIDWRKWQRTKARIHNLIEDVLDNLPDKYSDEIWPKTYEEVCLHVFDKYPSNDKSVYH